MPLLKNKEALKIQPLQIELTIRNHNNQPPPGLAAGSQKLVLLKPPEMIPMTKPSLKTGCKNFNLSKIKAIVYSVVCNRLFNQFLSHGCTEDTVTSQYLLYSLLLSGVLTSVNTLYP